MSPQIKVTLRLDLKDGKKVLYVMKALIPDNVNFPRGLSMDMNAEGKFLILSFKSSRKLDSLISTIDEILEHISTMNQVLR
ncbi:MAG: KEOPS complex subunit Pcc1 [Nitrososphaerales archaeon]